MSDFALTVPMTWTAFSLNPEVSSVTLLSSASFAKPSPIVPLLETELVIPHCLSSEDAVYAVCRSNHLIL